LVSQPYNHIIQIFHCSKVAWKATKIKVLFTFIEALTHITAPIKTNMYAEFQIINNHQFSC